MTPNVFQKSMSRPRNSPMKNKEKHNSSFCSHHSTLSWAILSIASLPRTATRPHFLGGPCSPEAPPHAMRRTCRSPPLIMAEGLTLQRHYQTLPGPIFSLSAKKIGLMMVSLKKPNHWNQQPGPQALESQNPPKGFMNSSASVASGKHCATFPWVRVVSGDIIIAISNLYRMIVSIFPRPQVL